jgi:predicted nucleic acid-binding protein
LGCPDYCRLLEAGVETLYTEDFGGQSQFDGLRIINPFLAAQ